jgi:hypothetical protein
VIADYAESKGAATRIIPTVVDMKLLRLCAECQRTVGIRMDWNTPTFPYLKTLFPYEISHKTFLGLGITGAGEDSVIIPGVQVESSHGSSIAARRFSVV